jgi:hypothetical protein
MTVAVREFDWSYELGMYAGVTVAILLVLLAVGGLAAFAAFLVRGGRRRRSDMP